MSQSVLYSRCAAWALSLALSQASGQAVPITPQPIQTSDPAASRLAAAATSPAAEGSPEAEAFVRRLIRDPRILMQPWKVRLKVFPKGCLKLPDEWDLQCPSIPGIAKMSASSNQRGMVSVVFKPPMTCERLHALVRRRLGPPTDVEPDDPCGGYWELDRWHVPGSLVVSRRLYENGEVQLQMGAEQGP